ncbi:MAG: YqeG family HAD IIIA-type phosphatase, partial [Thermotogaceae bacterium]|nr:YqeG family HAD IIIA-type phosphatase [Thermotogaceae bacterium]
PWGEIKIKKETEEIFKKLNKMGAKVLIVTNAKKDRVNHIREEFPWIEVYWSVRKPSIKRISKILSEKDISPSKCVIIGDLFLTDILVGNRLGMYTIMVNPQIYEAMKVYKKIVGTLSIILYRTFFFLFGWFFRIGALISPNEWKDNVREVNYDSLIKNGFELFIFDFDNTLAPWKSTAILKENKKLLEELSKKAKVLIASNSSPRQMNNDLNLEIIWRSYKPFAGKIKRRIKDLGVNHKRVVVIGDQLFTDVLFGNLIGAYTIKVNPIKEEEAVVTKINRFLEKVFSKVIVQKPTISCKGAKNDGIR